MLVGSLEREKIADLSALKKKSLRSPYSKIFNLKNKGFTN